MGCATHGQPFAIALAKEEGAGTCGRGIARRPAPPWTDLADPWQGENAAPSLGVS